MNDTVKSVGAIFLWIATVPLFALGLALLFFLGLHFSAIGPKQMRKSARKKDIAQKETIVPPLP